jgi:hypothetical protein
MKPREPKGAKEPKASKRTAQATKWVRRIVVAGAVAAAALAITTVLLLPPPAAAPVPPEFLLAWPVARGAYHVHSSRSDGTGTIDEIAAAAAAAGLQFVILTDHGNGTRPPEPPTYRAGVLCIDGVEISTDHGHYIALDLPQSPYPLAGHPREVIEDVRRLGGFGFAAHPGSPKAELQWTDWEAHFDGLEWLNADSEWRDEFWTSLGGVLLTYAFRPVETLGTLLDRPAPVLQQWDRLTRRRRVASIAGADAHARLGLRQASDPYQDRVLAKLPSYEVSFRAFANHVILNGALTGDAAADAALVIAGIREGRMFTSIDSLAGFSAFEAKATSGNSIARLGEYLAVGAAAAIEARIAAPPGTRLSVIRDGSVLYEVNEPALRLDVGTEAGAYRIEAHLPGSSAPWVLSNPMYVGLAETHTRAAQSDDIPPSVARSPIATSAWRAEASDGSTSALQSTSLEDGTPALEWSFTLAPGAKAEQYAAMRFPVDAALRANDRLQLRVRSDRPRRMWAQLRAPGAREGERWGRTFYVDPALNGVDLRFDQFRPLGPTSSERPALDRVDSLLLVIDTLNNQPGSAGRIWITDLWLAK